MLPNNLETLRNNIDLLDCEISKLLVERFLLSKKIGFYKQENKLNIIDSNRELIVIDSVVHNAKQYIDNKLDLKDSFKEQQIIDAIVEIYKKIIEDSGKIQNID